MNKQKPCRNIKELRAAFADTETFTLHWRFVVQALMFIAEVLSEAHKGESVRQFLPSTEAYQGLVEPEQVTLIDVQELREVIDGLIAQVEPENDGPESDLLQRARSLYERLTVKD